MWTSMLPSMLPSSLATLAFNTSDSLIYGDKVTLLMAAVLTTLLHFHRFIIFVKAMSCTSRRLWLQNAMMSIQRNNASTN